MAASADNEQMQVSYLQANCDAPGAGAIGGKLPTGRARVRLLYEEYVHLPLLRQVSVDIQSLAQSLDCAPRAAAVRRRQPCLPKGRLPSAWRCLPDG